MQNNIKAIFFDVDGTLISYHTHKMPNGTQKALETLRRNGVALIPASGRPPYRMSFLSDFFAFEDVVGCNGQLCYRGGESIRRHPFRRDAMERLVDFLRRHPFPCLMVGEKSITINAFNDAVYAHCRHTGQPLPEPCDAERALREDIFQLVIYTTPELEKACMQALDAAIPFRSEVMCLDIIPEGGGKPEGMQAMMQALGIQREETMAFGDGTNDMDMLRFAGAGVAMGNASKEVQASADYVTADVDEDGIAKALLHFGLIS